MTLRLFVEQALAVDTEFTLPPGAARHAQVRRVQPGDALRLFDGAGHDWPATVLAMGRSEVKVQVGAPQAVSSELPVAVTLALGMPANDRMDALVEKASELGVTTIQPLMTARSVLRLHGERAARKQAHWQAIAVAACEQCGRARVPRVAPVLDLADWLPTVRAADTPPLALLLSLQPGAPPLRTLPWAGVLAVTTLSGPEGGLSPDEHAAAMAAGFSAVALGPRVLRAETAAIVAGALLGALRVGLLSPGR